VSENAPKLKAAVASVLVNAVVIVATTTVVFVLAVIIALPELNFNILPTSVASQPTPPLIPVIALAVIFTPVPPPEAGVKVVAVVFVEDKVHQ
jgi:hypothetical protein